MKVHAPSMAIYWTNQGSTNTNRSISITSTRGARLVTYAIRAENHSGIISVNGAAARLAAPGDILIICAYAAFNEQELLAFKPRLIYLNTDNGIERTGDSIPVQRQKQP